MCGCGGVLCAAYLYVYMSMFILPAPFSQSGGTALMIAAQKGHDELVRILLRDGKCKKDQADAVNDGLQYVYMLELVCPGCGYMLPVC